MKAEIIATGTELLLGEIVDTNSSYLASRLPALGIDLYWVTQVGDNRDRMGEALRTAWERSDLVFTTGGLGPTQGDITRECIARLLGEEMKVDPTLQQELRDFFARRNMPMPERNLKQAHLIPSARGIPNPRGTAPGWWVERDGRIIVAMPGPPAEMQRMWEKEVSPRLQPRSQGGIILKRTFKTFGIGEAMVDEMVTPLLPSANPTLAIYARADGIQLRAAAKSPTRREAEAMLAESERLLREILGDAIWGVDSETIESSVGDLLIRKGLTLATSEDCTGGYLANLLTETPNSRQFYRGGQVLTLRAVGECDGADEPCAAAARRLAAAVRRRFKAGIGAAITGAVSEDPEKGPAPQFYAAIYDGRTCTEMQGFLSPRPDERKRRPAVGVLFKLRQSLLAPGSQG